MQNNLEGIGFGEVMNKSGMSYVSFRDQLKPIYSKVFFDILRGYLFLWIISAVLIITGQRLYSFGWLTIPLGAIAIGYVAAYLALFIHEAGHFNLHPDKKINDRIATLFLCLAFGLSMKSYRKVHWQHHVHLGTPEDAEVSYFHALSRLFLAESLTGIHLLRTMFRKSGKNVLTQVQQRQSRLMLLAGVLLHAVIITLGFLTGNWTFAIAWIAGFGLFFPFFASIRQILEHRDELAQSSKNYFEEPHGKVSRLFKHTLLSGSFGSAGFTRHMIHHWDPQISYTRLKDIENFLSESEKTARIIESSKTSYRSTLKKLMRAS